jgi:glycosyltransferase involved in cell wall biosynthesis
MTDIINTELVSIVMPNYNNVNYISDSIRSVLNQSYSNIELIVCDDCSTDHSLSIISEFARMDNRIRVISSNTNLGPSAQMNIGIRNARGKFLARIDSDDIYHYKKIETQLDFLNENSNYKVCFTGFEYFSDGWDISKIGVLNIDNDEIKTELLRGMRLHGATFMCETAVIKEFFFDENIVIGEDYDFVSRLALKFNFFNIGKILYHYRKNNMSLTNNHKMWDMNKIANISLRYIQAIGIDLTYEQQKVYVDVMYPKSDCRIGINEIRHLACIVRLIESSEFFNLLKLRDFILAQISQYLLSTKKHGLGTLMIFYYYPQVSFHLRSKGFLQVFWRSIVIC